LKTTVRHSCLSGSVAALPSKSLTHRALFCAALAEGESEVHSALKCDDTVASVNALSRLGVTARWEDANAFVSRHGELKEPTGMILCGESGTTLRFMTAVCATMPYEAHIAGELSLLRRPIKDLAVALNRLGAECACDEEHAPVRVKGPIRGGSVEMAGNVSSQYISALLLAAPLAKTPVDIRIDGRLESKSYVKMTLEMQSKFGARVSSEDDLTKFRSEPHAYQPADVQIEGDWSSAAFLFAGAAIAGEKIKVDGLNHGTTQADRHILHVLETMNAGMKVEGSSVTVEKSQLTPVKADVSDCPDLFPALCALCAVADGVSTVTGTRRLRLKESDRILAMSNGLKQMRIDTKESESSFTIYGGRPHGATIDPHHDHRIAMAFAMLGLCTEGVTVLDSDCVAKSYPSFWQDLESLGAELTIS